MRTEWRNGPELQDDGQLHRTNNGAARLRNAAVAHVEFALKGYGEPFRLDRFCGLAPCCLLRDHRGGPEHQDGYYQDQLVHV